MQDSLARAKSDNEELEDALTGAKKVFAAAETDADDAHEAMENGRSAEREMKSDLYDAQERIERAKAPAAAAAAAGPSADPGIAARLRKCSSTVQRVWRDIRRQKAGTFRELPKGPIAVYIKMKPGFEKWARAAERAIGVRHFNTFLVNDMADYNALKKLIRPHEQGSVAIVRTKFLKAPLPMPAAKLPGSTLTSVFDALASDDDDVMNCLINDRGIERKIVVTQLDASNVMFARGGAPRNVSEALDESATIYKMFGQSRSKVSFLFTYR